MKFFKTMFLCAVVWLVLIAGARAQTPQEIKKADKVFSGFWVDKKTSRHLLIGVEKDGYVIINDWVGKMQDRGSADAYKAYIKGAKLIMPPDHEHHAPYAEMQIINHKLVYTTRFKDIEGKEVISKQVFVKAEN
jgi:hypothetical protein